MIDDIPATSFTGSENSESCSSENSLHDAYSNATKIRHFCINGDISVTETISYAEVAEENEASVGDSSENFNYQETAGTASAGVGVTHTLTTCNPAVTTSGGGAVGGNNGGGSTEQSDKGE